MSAPAATATTQRPLSPGGAIAGFVLGWMLIHVVLYLSKAWAIGGLFGEGNFDMQLMLGLEFTKGHLALGFVGGMLGMLGGLLGGDVYRAPGFLRALLGLPIGFFVGATIVMLVRVAFGLDAYSMQPVIIFGWVGSLLGFLYGVGGLSYWIDYCLGRPTPVDDHSGHGARSWKDYFTFNTDHKVIGIQYLVLTFSFMVAAGLMAEVIRAELARPGIQFVEDGNMFNGMFSAHAAIMIFMFIIPAFAGIANYVVPIMLGAPDMAFPRLNALSFWLLAFSGLTALTVFVAAPFASGWTNYPPLSTSFTGEIGIGQLIFTLLVQVAGASSIMTAINFIVTIIGMRAPGMTIWRMPLLVWANLTTSLLVTLGTPFIAGSQFMVMFDMAMGTNFFKSVAGGDAILYQHVFWFYSHPAVYIMMLPGFGMISEIVSAHSRKPIFGYRALALSTVAIGFLGFSVWAHHMFSAGMTPWLRIPMMFLTMLIAVPTGVKVLGWAATLWNGRIHLTTAMMFALGFIFTFTVGGITGIMLASIPFDISTTDSYFVVAHIHYVLFGGSFMTIFAGVYHWFPKMTGRMYDETIGRWHFWVTFIGMNLAFFPMHWIGTLGMPRRVSDYTDLVAIHPSIDDWNMVSSIGAFIMGAGVLLFFYNVVNSWARGPVAPSNPWEAHTLEWQVTSPPPLFNFHETPLVVNGPYEFGTADPTHATLEPSRWIAEHPDSEEALAAGRTSGASGEGS